MSAKTTVNDINSVDHDAKMFDIGISEFAELCSNIKAVMKVMSFLLDGSLAM